MKNLLLKLIAVGRIKDPHYQAKIAEFLTRLGAYGKLEVVELRDDTVEKESQAILKQLERERGLVVVLDEHGRTLTSAGLAQVMAECDRRMVFVVGGAYGFADAVRGRADLVLSLSAMTFTHEMARLVLVEQLYRAATILAGKKYHHE